MTGRPLPGLVLRSATADDSSAIRRLIGQVRINPTGLDWRRFVVAVDASDRLLGCGQLKPHAGGIVELASIAVVPSRRNTGIARGIVERLIKHAPRPLYLTCRASMGPFYENWGFLPTTAAEMPPYFRRLSRLARILSGVLRDEGMLVMMLK
jgi:N-acetylglutamate synthase-like GNAT family acetyltransferase